MNDFWHNFFWRIRYIPSNIADLIRWYLFPKTLEKCDNCSKLAVWDYAPSGQTHLFCDDCVPRGCSCNIVDPYNKSPNAEEHRDEQGRLLPCIEYWYDKRGWKIYKHP